jgi:uncharacterized protein (DUF433 family)
MTAWIYVGTARAAGAEATRELARRGGLWAPGPHLPRPDPGVAPGDVIALLWREDADDEEAVLLGAARVATPTKPWGGRAWIEAVRPGDPLFQASVALGYGGPRNYRAMARFEGWTEDAAQVRRLLPGLLPGAVVGGRLRGVPSHRLVAELKAGMLHPALPQSSSEDTVLLARIEFRPGTFGGKPVVRGLRVGVEHVLAWLAHGASEADVVAEIPGLEAEDVRACLLYAARRVGNERVEPTLGA